VPTEGTRVGHVKKDDTDVYAGRGPSQAGEEEKRHLLSVPLPNYRGWLGNPYPAEKFGRKESIEKFREAFEQKLDEDPEFREAVKALRGKVLGCWCQRLEDDGPACHAEVVAEWADRLATQEVGQRAD
jgi:hypothetical protein